MALPLVEAREVENGPAWLQWTWPLPLLLGRSFVWWSEPRMGVMTHRARSHSLLTHFVTLGKSYLCGFDWPYVIPFCRSTWESRSLYFVLKLCAKLFSEGRSTLGLKGVATSGFRNDCKKLLFTNMCYFFFPFPILSLQIDWRLLDCYCFVIVVLVNFVCIMFRSLYDCSTAYQRGIKSGFRLAGSMTRSPPVLSGFMCPFLFYIFPWLRWTDPLCFKSVLVTKGEDTVILNLRVK